MQAPNIEHILRREIARLTHSLPEEVAFSLSLGELGVDSVGYVEIAAVMEKECGIKLQPEILFEHANLQATLDYLCILQGQKYVPVPSAPSMPTAQTPSSAADKEFQTSNTSSGSTSNSSPASPAAVASPAATAKANKLVAAQAYRDQDIAIIGSGLRLPGANDMASFWQMLQQGDIQTQPFPAERVPQVDQANVLKKYMQGGFVADATGFDASFFGISPREAMAMDAQQRLLLEAAWHALEDAAYPPERITGSNTAVFIGASSFDYYELLLKTGGARTTHIGTGVSHAVLANRLSQYFNLKGESEVVDCACASSLVALMRGVRTIQSGASQMALVGGVNLLASTTTFQFFADAGMLSQAGQCLPFDAQAAGYVRGEGVACVVLKQANAALADGDRILAIIKGGAVRHSGRTQSLTAPNPAEQAEVIIAAMQEADIDPASIGYIEAHGTGTSLGDPIELQGLKSAYTKLHQAWGHALPLSATHCELGSVKAQIGHLEACAGLAGALKAVAVLQHGSIPALKHLHNINPLIELTGSPFHLPQQQQAWPVAAGVPRRAGVSSFGFGGSNCHLVLEQAPVVKSKNAFAKPLLFILSAKSASALRKYARNLHAWWQIQQSQQGQQGQQNPSQAQQMRDLAYTLQVGRSAMPFRAALLATDGQQLSAGLLAVAEQGLAAARNDIFCAQVPRGSVASVDANELASMFAKAQWAELAAVWLAGAGIAWPSLYPRRDAQLLTLPQYPFEHEVFWPRYAPENTVFVQPNILQAAGSQATISQVSMSQASDAANYFQGIWQAQDLPASHSPLMSGAVALLVGGNRGQLLARKLASAAPQVQWRVLDCSSAEKRQQSLASWDAQASLQAFLDVSAFDQDSTISFGAAEKLALVQQLLASDLKRGHSINFVHATCGMQEISVGEGEGAQMLATPSNLSGAAEAGLFMHLSAEYKRCQSKSIDFAQFDPTSIARQLLLELATGSASGCFALVHGQRLQHQQKALQLPPASQSQTFSVAMITGGLGAIGMHLARDLAKQACRAMLLTARSAITPAQQEMLNQLHASGIAVQIYRGELTDAANLSQVMQNFQQQHGKISHIFHCAGVADKENLAFYQKNRASMESVFAPKIAALNVLHEITRHAPPQAFILFSSVSALAPSLAAGVLDYAAANHYMDLFAQYQHAMGNHYYCAVQWTRWQDTGMASSKHGSAANTASGAAQAGLSAPACLASLWQIIALGENMPASICVLGQAESAQIFAYPQMQSVAAKVLSSASSVSSVSNSASQPVQIAPAGRLQEIQQHLRQMVAKELELPIEKLDLNASFEALGIDSIVLMGLISNIEKWLGLTVEPQQLIDCNSISNIAQYLSQLNTPSLMQTAPIQQTMLAAPAPAPASAPASTATATAATTTAPFTPAAQQMQAVPQSVPSNLPSSRFDVAVVGMACHFPGAPDVFSFWNNLEGAVDSVREVPASRWNAQQFYSPEFADGKSISRWGGFIDGIEEIDPKMFAMREKDAADVDPLLRLFTECSIACADNAHGGAQALKGKRVGVFAGARVGQYAQRISTPGKQSVTGIGQNFIAAHVAHLLDLHGPAFVLDSACSSSLAAIHLACQSLATGDSEMALAGGVDVLLDEQTYMFLSASHALSPTGHCRTFDASADGFVPGEGVGCVLLKPLAAALADGDPIYAVIAGSAINNDGHTLGITTPGVAGQVDVIERALRKAHLSPSDISYVEAHGTGTLIGDPIELQALSRAFAAAPPVKCGVGSVKTNIGHLLSAAGVASFIKVALALHHQTLPPTLHCEKINPRFDFDKTPFYPVQQKQAWQGPMNAGISAFGFGKTNVHMILSPAPAGAIKPQIKAVPPAKGKIRAWHEHQTAAAPLDPALQQAAAATCRRLLEISNIELEEWSPESLPK